MLHFYASIRPHPAQLFASSNHVLLSTNQQTDMRVHFAFVKNIIFALEPSAAPVQSVEVNGVKTQVQKSK